MRRAVGAAVIWLSGLALAGACTPAAEPMLPERARMDEVPVERPEGGAGAMNVEPPPADSADPRWGGHIGSGT